MSSFSTFCDPSTGQTVRSDFATGHDAGSVFGNCAAILGGIPAVSPTNKNCSDLSVIVMGDCNHINTFGSPAANGCFNFIGNGFCNISLARVCSLAMSVADSCLSKLNSLQLVYTIFASSVIPLTGTPLYIM